MQLHVMHASAAKIRTVRAAHHISASSFPAERLLVGFWESQVRARVRLQPTYVCVDSDLLVLRRTPLSGISAETACELAPTGVPGQRIGCAGGSGAVVFVTGTVGFFAAAYVVEKLSEWGTDG